MSPLGWLSKMGRLVSLARLIVALTAALALFIGVSLGIAVQGVQAQVIRPNLSGLSFTLAAPAEEGGGANPNLLTAGSDFTNGAWGNFLGATTANTDVCPADGTTTADTLTDNVDGYQFIFQEVSLTAGTYTLSFYIKRTSNSGQEIAAQTAFSPTFRKRFDPEDGSSCCSTDGFDSVTLADAASGTWYRFIGVFTIGSTQTHGLWLYPGSDVAVWQSTIIVCGVKLEAGGTVTAFEG